MTPSQVCILLGYDEDPNADRRRLFGEGPRGPRRPGYCEHGRIAVQCSDCRVLAASLIEPPDDDAPEAERELVETGGRRARRVRKVV